MTEERERRYMAEFMKQEFPLGNWALNVPVGPIPRETIEELGLADAAAFVRPYRCRLDAVAWTLHVYILLEFKLRGVLVGLGNLRTYLDLAQHTPDLPGYTGQPFESWLVCPWALDWIQVATTEAGIKLKIFFPDWVNSYIEEYKKYYRADYRRARVELQRTRRILGVDKITLE